MIQIEVGMYYNLDCSYCNKKTNERINIVGTDNRDIHICTDCLIIGISKVLP